MDTYHHVPDRERYFRELKKALRPGGRLAIIDFTLDRIGRGVGTLPSPATIVRKHREVLRKLRRQSIVLPPLGKKNFVEILDGFLEMREQNLQLGDTD